MVEHLPTNVGDTALADPRHQVKTRKRADRQPHHQEHEQTDGLVEQMWRLGHEPLIHQQSNALPHGQGDASSHDQCEQRTERVPSIRHDKTTGQANGTAVTGREHRNHPEHRVNGVSLHRAIKSAA
ncbi:hypothetical protein D3C84_434900 [compost metagenome]